MDLQLDLQGAFHVYDTTLRDGAQQEGLNLSVALELTLFVSGVALAAALYYGPGGSRVRRPLSRIVVPLSRTSGRWGLALAAVVLAAIVLGLVSEAGIHWVPATDRPGS